MKRTEKLSRKARYGILAAIVAGAFSIMPVAQALPVGGTSETAAIAAQSGSKMEITSSVTQNLLTWHDFSVANGEEVAFGGANTYLNVVTGNNRSLINGAVTGSQANVYLVNPNGILIGSTGSINVASLHLSTADISASLTDFIAASSALASAVAKAGDIVNTGKLTAAQEITVAGENITFKNIADVSAPSVSLTSVNPAHLGYSAGEEATEVTNSQYKDVDAPELTGYTTNQDPVTYMLVRNKYELQNMQNNLSGNYMLAGDIDMSGASFTPIGNKDQSFKGKFDGLNYKISDLEINEAGVEGVGLFGKVENGTIENVGRVGGSTLGGTSVGAIVGILHDGTIRNVYNTGSVEGTDRGEWAGASGGIVGHVESSTVQNVYNTGDVETTNRGGGGIIGRITSGNVENA